MTVEEKALIWARKQKGNVLSNRNVDCFIAGYNMAVKEYKEVINKGYKEIFAGLSDKLEKQLRDDEVRNPSKIEKKKNKVHFYIARNKNNRLWLYMGKPRRYDDEFRAYLDKGSKYISGYDFNAFGLNEKDYDNLKWEDEPVEVFLNMED